MLKQEPKRGFTLIELMLVVTIIGILAAIAVPKFAQMARKAKEGSTKGNLGALRGAIMIYYGDMEGQYPSNSASLTTSGKYMSYIPSALTPDYHAPSTSFELTAIPTDDQGGWVYNGTSSDANFGTILVNCVHTDTKGSKWTTY